MLGVACAGFPSGATNPIGSPGWCPGDDATGIPLERSAFPSELGLDAARRFLDVRNENCGDTWCEGSFEWFFYDLRGDAKRSELTMRVYAETPAGPYGNPTGIVVSGPGYTGRVLASQVVPSCTTPCEGFASPPRWAPCVVADLRCEIDRPFTDDLEWESVLIDCGIAVEQAFRQVVPEF